jgi:carbon-monoxide dehydrogenase medium subunit
VVVRATEAEAILEGKMVSEGLIAEAAKVAVAEASPIDDFRASKEYRNDLIEVGARRTLLAALAAANG